MARSEQYVGLRPKCPNPGRRGAIEREGPHPRGHSADDAWPGEAYRRGAGETWRRLPRVASAPGGARQWDPLRPRVFGSVRWASRLSLARIFRLLQMKKQLKLVFVASGRRGFPTGQVITRAKKIVACGCGRSRAAVHDGFDI